MIFSERGVGWDVIANVSYAASAQCTNSYESNDSPTHFHQPFEKTTAFFSATT